jgi:hypothetical protein
MNVPLLDLQAQYATIREKVQARVDEVFTNQSFVLGSHVSNLEKEIAAAEPAEKRRLQSRLAELRDVVKSEKLGEGKVKPTIGDMRCILYGHLLRLAVWHLRKNWDKNERTEQRMERVEDYIRRFGVGR